MEKKGFWLVSQVDYQSRFPIKPFLAARVVLPLEVSGSSYTQLDSMTP